MTLLIDAIKMCESNKVFLMENVNKIKETIGGVPKFVIINASDNPANERYIEGKVREGNEIGLDVVVKRFSKECNDLDIENVINECNEKCIPVILQEPTYEHINSKSLISKINHKVDADGFTKEWIGEIALGNDRGIAPATPKGVMNLLEFHEVGIEGKIALVIGRSNHVGKPMATMLTNKGATVIHANSKTKDLRTLVMQSDIVISCVGQKDLINANDIKPGAVVIGVGFTYEDRKQILDFDVEKVVRLGNAKFVSNRINCTGKATINALLDNVVMLYVINNVLNEMGSE